MKKNFTHPFKKFKQSLILACTVILLLQSCKKEIFEAANKKPIAEELKWAADYYKEKLEPNKNLLVMPTRANSTESTTNKARTNKMTVLWEQAYSSKTSLNESVEVPVNIDGKLMPTFIVTKDPKTKPVLDLEVINASLNRVYLYKDKDGIINQNLITYVPDKDYLRKHQGSISHNHIDKLDEDFFGYIQYKDWDGNVLFVLRIENGKTARKIETSNTALIDQTVKQNGNLPIDDQKQTNNYQVATCDEWTIRYDWEQWCYYQGTSQTPTYCDPVEVSNVHITPNCPGGSSGGNPPNNVVNVKDPADAYELEVILDSIKLAKKFECFDNVPDNSSTTYSAVLYAELADKDRPDALLSASIPPVPGHTFITLTKTNGSITVSETFGFYPENHVKASTQFPVNSMVSNNQYHPYDTSLEMNVNGAQFTAMMNAAITGAKNKYQMVSYNCTDFALSVFNQGRSVPLNVPHSIGPITGRDYGKTPSGVYETIKNMKTNGVSGASITPGSGKPSTDCN